MLTFIAISVFLSVGLLVGVVIYPIFDKRNTVRTRLVNLMDEEICHYTILPTRTKWQVFMANLGIQVRMNPADLRAYRSLVTAAGFRKEAVYIFLGSKLFLAVALPAVFVVLYALPYGKASGNTFMLFTVAAAIAGWLLPTFWIEHVGEKRKIEIFHSLPDLLDLLTICVEAGLGLDAALIKAVENTQDKKDPLIKEISTVTLEIRAGKPRSEALQGLAERTMVEDISSFVSMLIQTEKFGTSLSRGLRVYSDSLRTKRRQLAEEKAAKTAVKMLIPLTFCVFPGLLVVMLTPAVFKIYQVLIKA